jgi:hypothetical protein
MSENTNLIPDRKKRLVQVYNSKNNALEEVETDAQLFGELKHVFKLDPESQRILIKESKVTLEHDEAELPEGDFFLFVSVKKVKSGADAPDFSSMKYNELRSLCKEKTGFAPATKDQIIQSLIDHHNKNDKGLKAEVAPEKVAEKKAEFVAKATESIPETEHVEFSKDSAESLKKLMVVGFTTLLSGLNSLLDDAGFETIETPVEFEQELKEGEGSQPSNEVLEAERLEKEEKAREEREKQAKLEKLRKEAANLGML